MTISAELKTHLDDFHKTLSGIRAKQDEYDAALRRGKADPLTAAAIARMEDDLNALHKKVNRRRMAGGTFDSPSQMEVKANREFAKWTGGHDSKAARERYGEVFARYLRVDNKGALTPDEQKTLSVGSAPDGGFFVEPARSQRMVDKLYETSNLRPLCQVVTISSSSIKYPIDRDRSTTGWVGEQSARPQTDTPQIGELEIPVHEVYAMPASTQNMLDDGNIPVEEWLTQKVADEMGREENTQFVSGNGVSKPKGFTSYTTAATADSSRTFGTLEHKVTGSNGAFKTASSTVNPADDLFDLLYKFKRGYRGALRWGGTRITLGAIRKFKDQDGNYNIYHPVVTPQGGIIDTVLGYPFDELADMADYTTTGALGIVLADWMRAYVIVDRLGIRVLRDPYTAKPYVLFYTTKRVGGGVLDSDAIKFLKFST